MAKNSRMFADREQWNLEQLRFAMPTDQQVLKRLGATQSLQDIAKILGEAGIAVTPAKTKLDTAVIPADIYGRVATMPAGRAIHISSRRPGHRQHRCLPGARSPRWRCGAPDSGGGAAAAAVR